MSTLYSSLLNLFVPFSYSFLNHETLLTLLVIASLHLFLSRFTSLLPLLTHMDTQSKIHRSCQVILSHSHLAHTMGTFVSLSLFYSTTTHTLTLTRTPIHTPTHQSTLWLSHSDKCILFQTSCRDGNVSKLICFQI